MQKNLIDRIFKNWKTSLVGLVIILGSIAAVFFDKATLTEAGAFIVLSIGLFWSKDGSAAAPCLLFLLLTGCGAQYHINRAAFHQRMAFAKGADIKHDTVYTKIPVFTERLIRDTVVDRQTLTDTLFIDNVKYSIKLKYDTITSKEYVYVECKPDTVFVDVATSTQTTYSKKPDKIWAWVLAACLTVLILYLHLRKS